MIQRDSLEKAARLFSSISVSLMCTLIFSQASFSENVRGVTDTTIKIACIADQTGPIASIGIMIGEASKHYIHYINDQGELIGRKIKYFLEDGRYSIPIGIAAFKKLVFRDQIFAIMGPYCTGTIKALFDQIERLKIPNVAALPQPSVINPLKRYIFVTSEFYDDDLGVIFEHIMKEMKPKDPKIAFCAIEGESGKEVLESVRKWARLFKLKHPIHKEVIPLGALEVSSQVMSIKRKGATHILVHHSAPGAAVLLRELRKFGLSLPVFGSGCHARKIR